MAKRLLILEDGTIFEGQAFGADVDVTGPRGDRDVVVGGVGLQSCRAEAVDGHRVSIRWCVGGLPLILDCFRTLQGGLVS